MTTTVRIWFDSQFRQEEVGDSHVEWYLLSLISALNAGTIAGFDVRRGQTRQEYFSGGYKQEQEQEMETL